MTTWQPETDDWELPPELPGQMLTGPLEAALGAGPRSTEALLRALAAAAGLGDAEAELEDKAFSDCRYISCKRLGLSFRLRPPGPFGQVDIVFLYAEGADGFSEYCAGPLPLGLDWEHRSRDVVKRLGEPSDTFGGGRLPVGIGYETVGLDVHFLMCSWEDSKNQIKFLSVYQPTDAACGMCAKCAKQAKFRCSQCRRCSYCSSACQREDWPRHKEFCGVIAGPSGQQPTSGGELQKVAATDLGRPPGGEGASDHAALAVCLDSMD